MKIALITGITGQDGSYLTEQLLDKGYIDHGMCAAQAASTQDESPICIETQISLTSGYSFITGI